MKRSNPQHSTRSPQYQDFKSCHMPLLFRRFKLALPSHVKYFTLLGYPSMSANCCQMKRSISIFIFVVYQHMKITTFSKNIVDNMMFSPFCCNMSIFWPSKFCSNSLEAAQCWSSSIYNNVDVIFSCCRMDRIGATIIRLLSVVGTIS